MNLHVDLYETFWWSCTCNKKIARPTPTPRTRTRLANANGSCNARPGEKTNICCSISTLFLDSHMSPSRQSFKQFNQSPCSTVTVHKFTFTFTFTFTLTLLRQGTFHCIALSHWLIRYRQKQKCRRFWQFFAQANNYPRNVCSSTGIDFLQTKQRPTGTTRTSKYAGGASILMSWCFAFAKYSRDWD